MTQAARRVVVTGVGVICPLGSTKEALWEGLSQGRSGVGTVPFDVAMPGNAFPVSVGAPAGQFTGDIDDFGPLEKETKKAIRKGLKVMCRECQMGVAVAQLALADAGWKPGGIDPERVGISFGSDYMLSVPEEFSEGIVQCLDEQRPVPVLALGNGRDDEDVAAVAVEVPAEHAGQPLWRFTTTSAARTIRSRCVRRRPTRPSARRIRSSSAAAPS